MPRSARAITSVISAGKCGIPFVILLRVLARENKILNVGSFIILRSGKRITSLIKEIRVLTFLVKYSKIKLCRKSIL